MKRRKVITSIFCLLATTAVLLIWNYMSNRTTPEERLLQRKYLAKILSIETLPDTFEIEQIESWGFTDELVTCVAKISPNDFNTIISGRNFSQKTVSGTFHDHFSNNKLGKPYQASEVYVASNPKDFRFGQGEITLVVNSDQTRVGIDIYIE